MCRRTSTWEHGEELAGYTPRREALEDTSLELRFPASRAMRK